MKLAMTDVSESPFGRPKSLVTECQLRKTVAFRSFQIFSNFVDTLVSVKVYLYEGESVSMSQMDIKRKICDIRN
jgi:hypothetical protein